MALSTQTTRSAKGGAARARTAPVAIMHEYFDWHGHAMAFECFGPSDGSPILLMNGLLLDSLVNRVLARRLAVDGYRVILLDLLGHGASDRPVHATMNRIDFYGDQAVACLDHLGIERAVVGGVSLGAIATLHATVKYPERVRAQILEMPVMERSTIFAALLLVPLVLSTQYLRPVVRGFTGVMRRLPRPRKEVAASVMNAMSNSPEQIASVLHGILVGPVVPPYPDRKRITQPSLVIGHKGDWLHNLEDAHALTRQLPDARFIEARSILELRTKPDRLYPEIVGFLRAVAAQEEGASKSAV
ncbi:alpha/beta fold hydrolase [Algiphilus sp.]|uniref:alpha/beta fold hydrolase n=1 Tax=Algiphilus sp. TaxID=1872431 RepID=UPI0032EACF98